MWFRDGDLETLPSAVRLQLEQAVLVVEAIPSLERVSLDLGPRRQMP